MSLLKIKCPECNAGLKSPTGFAVGQTVSCPKCETYFAVEEPEDDDPPATGKKPVKAAADEEDDETPRKKKKRRAADDEDAGERSYKNSPLRFAVLGVLVVVMLVLAYFLYEKKKKEKETAGPGAAAVDDGEIEEFTPRLANPNQPGPKLVPIQPGVGGPNPNPKLPKDNNPKPKGVDVGGVAVNAFTGLLAGVGPRNQREADALTKKYTAALVGTWVADLGNGVNEQIVYTADGTFAAARTGAVPEPTTSAGKWSVKGLAGTKGLKLQLDSVAGGRAVTVVFEDGELLQPSLQPGVTAAFRKK